MNHHTTPAADGGFCGVTVFILAVDETESLFQTVQGIADTCRKEDIARIVIMLKSEQCPSFAYADCVIEAFPDLKIGKYVQKNARLENAIAELPALSLGSHFVMMCSDLENDPRLIAVFIEKAKQNPRAIISASKWHKDSVVAGYGFLRGVFSRAVNRFAGILFGCKGADFFSIYEIFPISVYRKLEIALNDDFFFELTLKPLAEGVPYFEIPTVYAGRTNGKTHFDIRANARVTLKFIGTAVRLRLNIDKHERQS